MTFQNHQISRRQLIQLSALSGIGLLLNGCNVISAQVGETFEPLNQKLQELILTQKPVAEFPISAIEPKQLIINTYDRTPEIDANIFRLIVDGNVNNPIQLSLTDIQKLPLTSMVIRHVCVEGWAAIVQWGGVRMQDLISLVQPKSNVRYVYFESADGYYESWDLASVMHPQTLMAYQHNGKPLSIDNGAPLRLASPVKLGYKLSKWVTKITFVDQLRPKQGYWEDQGYEWFAGL